MQGPPTRSCVWRFYQNFSKHWEPRIRTNTQVHYTMDSLAFQFILELKRISVCFGAFMVHLGFLWAFWFPSTSQKHAARWIVDAKICKSVLAFFGMRSGSSLWSCERWIHKYNAVFYFDSQFDYIRHLIFFGLSSYACLICRATRWGFLSLSGFSFIKPSGIGS